MDASSSQSVSDTDSIFPEIPHQPRAFHFPKREFGKKRAVRRCFQTAWFDKWPWPQYREKVHCLVSLILVMPARNATSERSFSALRRVKTFLRTTMTQQRLNNSMILFVHSNLTDKINLVELANEFIRGSEHRTECTILTHMGKKNS